jgi:hypothetical protein
MPVRTWSRRGRAAAALLLLLPAGCGTGGGEPADSAPTTVEVGVTPTETGPTTGSPAAVLTATKAFLAALGDKQKETVQAKRTPQNLAHWSNLPDRQYRREGLRMDMLSLEQKAGVLAILRSGLSAEGFNQVAGITTGDGVLANTAQSNLGFGADHYWIRILGTPSATHLWTVQYGGHHLAINMTMKGKAMTLAPSFWGAQPASYTAGGEPAEPLSGETRKAFALVGALDDGQRRKAVLGTAVTEVVLGAGRDGKTVANEGVRGADLTTEQRKLLTELTAEWIGTINPAAAKAKQATAAKELDRTYFAWSGATTFGNPIYYRVTSPSFVVEFAHQRGENEGGITHIHAIYREIGNDYGAKL